MIKKDFVIENSLGLHARAASNFVQLTNGFISEVEIGYNDDYIDGKSIMCIISMGIPKGGIISVSIKGPDEDESMKKLEEFLKEEILNV